MQSSDSELFKIGPQSRFYRWFKFYLEQLVYLLVVLLNELARGSFAEMLHEAALHRDPEAPGRVEQDGDGEQENRDPLVVGVVDRGLLVG